MATHKTQGRFCFTSVLNQREDARDLTNYEEPIVVEVTIWTATISNLNSHPKDNGEEVNGSDACEVRIEMKKFLKINKDWGHHSSYPIPVYFAQVTIEAQVVEEEDVDTRVPTIELAHLDQLRHELVRRRQTARGFP